MGGDIRTITFLFASLLALASCDFFESDPWEKLDQAKGDSTGDSTGDSGPISQPPLKPVTTIQHSKLPSDPAILSSPAYSPFVREGCFRWNGSTLSNILWLDDQRVMARGRFAEIKGALAAGNLLCAHVWTADPDKNKIKPALVTVRDASTFQFLYTKGGGRYQFLRRAKHDVVLLLRQTMTVTSPTSMDETVIEDGHLDIYASPSNYVEAAVWLVRKDQQTNKALPIRIPLKNRESGGEKKWDEPPLIARYSGYKKAYLLTPNDIERWHEKSCVPAWWLWLSGETEQICIPPWLKDKTTRTRPHVFPLIKAVTRVGALVQVGGSVTDGAGLYFIKNLRPEIILVGEVFNDPVVSPDGCKVVFNYKRDATSDQGALVSIDVCRKFLGG
jgi:hypothetical protein